MGQHFINLDPNRRARFYLTQRKCKFTVVLGHQKLRKILINSQIDYPHMRFLQEDRAGLGEFAKALATEGSFLGKVRLAKEGTIMFAGQPFGDIEGPLWNAQWHEVKFEHAFDLAMAVACRMMVMRIAAGDNTFLSVFSLRRDGDEDRSIEVSEAAYIAGADDTSCLEAAYVLGIPSVGTMAHFLVEAYVWYQIYQEIDALTKKPKHFEQVGFEKWLDDNPKGTILLIDTIDWKMGIVHAIAAALSTPERRAAFKGIRIDSGDLALEAKYCQILLEANGFKVVGAKDMKEGVGIILTGDLDAEAIMDIKSKVDFPILGLGIGTNLSSGAVAGVIFKMCEVEGLPVMKLSGTPGKATLPGELQVWRCVKDGMYVKDIVALACEPKPVGAEWDDAFPLLEDFDPNTYQNQMPDTIREFVKEQKAKFTVPLEEYPVVTSDELKRQMEQTIALVKKDENDYSRILGVEDAEAMLATALAEA